MVSYVLSDACRALRQLPRVLPRVLPRALLTLGLLAAYPAADAGTPVAWKEGGAYAYRAAGTPLNRVLSDFAKAQGSALASNLPPQLSVTGKLQAPSPEAFLDRLANDHQFQWFHSGGKLFVSSLGDRVIERIDIGNMTAADAKQALVGLGLFEPRFGWGELQEEGVVVISGPREYVRQVRAAISYVPEDLDPSTLVYKVRHGFLEDREIGFRDSTVKVPGLLSILRNLASDTRPESRLSDGGGSVGARGGADARGAEKIEAKAAAGRGNSGERAQVGKREERAVIEGDIRTNTLIIRDIPRKREYYRAVLKALDVPLQLIEIEAVIIDVERNRMHELGIDWSMAVGGGSGRTTVGVGNAAKAVADVAAGTLTIANPGRLLAAVRAMEGQGDARVVARPAITTMDNLAAVIDLSQTQVLKVVGERTATTRDLTAGTMLKVTPKIVHEGGVPQVRLLIDIEDGKLIPGANGSEASTIARTVVATQTMVDDQKSLVIGGFQVRNEGNGQRGVPGLRSLPWVGGLFRWEDSTDTSRERIFMITPRVIDQAAAQRQAQRLRDRERLGSGDAGAAGRVDPAASSPAPAVTDAPVEPPSPTRPMLTAWVPRESD